MRFYLGPDGAKRSRDEYVAYLRRCAALWRLLASSYVTEREVDNEAAEAVERKADQIERGQ